MQHGYLHDPYYDSYPDTLPFLSGIDYPNLHNSETVGTDPRTAKKESNEKKGHTHGNLGATTCQEGHVHMHPGVTSTPIETENSHIHYLSGNTTFEDGHIHHYEAYTSPPISLPNGYHTHYVEIRTTRDDGHTHVIKGFTEPSMS